MKNMSTSTKAYLLINTILTIGVHGGCQYCLPLLIAALFAGAAYKASIYTVLARSEYV